MPTKLIVKAHLGKFLLGSVAAGLMAAPAFAGGQNTGVCGGGNCAVPVQVVPGYAPQFGPMTVRNTQPMGHLRSIQFQRAPNVSIMRVHGMRPTAGLSDAPSGFTGGCHPTSTTYCRQEAGVPVSVELNAPVYNAPAPVYVQPAPVVSEPVTVRVGGGYDPSKFTPRVYGDPTPVPGIAYLPTSTVVRDPAAAQAVLDSGQTVPQPVLGRDTFGGTAPTPGMMRAPSVQRSITLPGTFRPSVQRSVTLPGTFQPAMGQSYGGGVQMRAPGLTNTQGLVLAPTRPSFGNQGPSFGQPGAPLLQQSGPMAGAYGSRVGADGTYWEKVSGPTAFGDTIATSVICKRKLPTQVVNPVVNVPVPVPVPVPQGCATVPVPGGRYGRSAPGRWTH